MRTNVRETSLMAYDAIRADGTAATQAGRVLRFIRENPRCSRSEISEGARIRLASVCGRVAQLIEDGLVEEVGTKRCEVTRKPVLMLTAVPAQRSLLEEGL